MKTESVQEIIEAFLDSLPKRFFEGKYSFQPVLDKLEMAAGTRIVREKSYAEDRRQQKAASRQKLEGERFLGTRALIDSGYLKKGSFIKVTGARDTNSIREVVDIHRDNKHLTCRKWSPVNVTQKQRNDPMNAHFDDWRENGYLKIDGKWYRPEPYMTTHGYSKVATVIAS
ncbi:hypothetical protein E4H12_01885 [Candidatus Thorarchaeota archaeon]|nr:MAG: hypothetical protein E4H12_01885 [Candidatus Thorarchaeota archaeon]